MPGAAQPAALGALRALRGNGFAVAFRAFSVQARVQLLKARENFSAARWRSAAAENFSLSGGLDQPPRAPEARQVPEGNG